MNTVEFQIENQENFKNALVELTKEYGYASILDSNGYRNDSYGEFDLIAGFGAKSIVVSNKWSELKALTYKKAWLFGFLSYDLKNQVEELKSENIDGLNFPDLCFFEPEILIKVKERRAIVEGEKAEEFSVKLSEEVVAESGLSSVKLIPRISKEKYIKQVIQLLNHIQLGDIFEVNFCQEFYAENVEISPQGVYRKLNKTSPTPFGCFLKVGDKYCMGASPERFIQKRGNKVISQPIKGTVKRGDSPAKDEELKVSLKASEKERSENVMIVDLVRNDFSRFAQDGSVKVEELFGIYSFPQVHQMISTISCEVKNESPVDILKECFPMGSMTGAPKVRAMKLIEKYESTKRGLYSGAIGYIKPNGDFDFNVVIRSLFYNQSAQFLSFMVGGAITSKSSPQSEYDESILKAKAIFEILHN